jgi:hypothetical protein
MMDKKEHIDREVTESTGLLEKVSYYFKIIAKIKTFCALHYYYFTYKDDGFHFFAFASCIIMIMAFIHKVHILNSVIKSKKSKKVTKMFKKAIYLALLFGIAYLFWSTYFFSDLKQSRLDNSTKKKLKESQIVIKNFEATPKFEDLSKNVRIGFPVANHKPKFSDQPINAENMREYFSSAEHKNGMVNRDDQKYQYSTNNYIEKLAEIPDISEELPIIMLTIAIHVAIAIELSVFFIYFSKYKNALQMQEKIDAWAKQLVVKRVKQNERNEEEKVVVKEQEVRLSPDEPIIQEETMTVPTKFTLGRNDNRIVHIEEEVETSYPTIDPLPQSMERLE